MDCGNKQSEYEIKWLQTKNEKYMKLANFWYDSQHHYSVILQEFVKQPH